MTSTLAIGVSCLDHRLFQVIQTLSQVPNDYLPIIAIQRHPLHPLSDSELQLHLQHAKQEGIQCLVLDSIGLTKSRNAIINACQANYLLLADDDQTFIWENISLLIQVAEKNPGVALFTGQIQCPDGSLFKSYPKRRFRHNKRSILSVASIEMLLHLKHPALRHTRFREDFGLGTKKPASEECLFLYDVLQAGGPSVYIPLPLAQHPKESSADEMTPERAQARGESLAIIFGCLAYALFPLYMIKQRRVYASQLSAFQFLKHLLKGASRARSSARQ